MRIYNTYIPTLLPAVLAFSINLEVFTSDRSIIPQRSSNEVNNLLHKRKTNKGQFFEFDKIGVNYDSRLILRQSVPEHNALSLLKILDLGLTIFHFDYL